MKSTWSVELYSHSLIRKQIPERKKRKEKKRKEKKKEKRKEKKTDSLSWTKLYILK